MSEYPSNPFSFFLKSTPISKSLFKFTCVSVSVFSLSYSFFSSDSLLSKVNSVRSILPSSAPSAPLAHTLSFFPTSPSSSPILPASGYQPSVLETNDRPKPPTRKDNLLALKEKNFDIVIIGGGATGSGIALDAVTRGMSVALVERDDFASGTSSRSTKLVHGGVRYLEKAVTHFDLGQLSLVWEALFERKQLLSNAPHLTSVLPILTPCYSWWEIPYYWTGLKLYDLVSGRSKLPGHTVRALSVTESLKEFPMIQANKLKGCILYNDGQMNDARLNVAIALTATQHGAVIANHVEVIDLVKEKKEQNPLPQESNIVSGIKCRDTLTGDEFIVNGKVVVNATGPYVDMIRKMDSPNLPPLVTPSSGTHIILPDYFSPVGMGLIIPKTKDGRVVFSLPWEGYTLAGTTDAPTDLTFKPAPTRQEIQFILETLRPFLSLPVDENDVLSAWSGIRPLALNPKGSKDGTENIVRDHSIVVSPSGMVNVTGGKWTTYRLMSEQTVDKCLQVGKFDHAAKHSQTKQLRLVGGENYHPLLYTELARYYSRKKLNHEGRVVTKKMPTDVAIHLAHSYGDQAYRVCELAQSGFGQRLVSDYPYIEAEVIYSMQYEYAQTAVDILGRRTRLGFLSYHDSVSALPHIIHLMATHNNWSEQRKKQELRDALDWLQTMRVP